MWGGGRGGWHLPLVAPNHIKKTCVLSWRGSQPALSLLFWRTKMRRKGGVVVLSLLSLLSLFVRQTDRESDPITSSGRDVCSICFFAFPCCNPFTSPVHAHTPAHVWFTRWLGCVYVYGSRRFNPFFTYCKARPLCQGRRCCLLLLFMGGQRGGGGGGGGRQGWVVHAPPPSPPPPLSFLTPRSVWVTCRGDRPLWEGG